MPVLRRGLATLAIVSLAYVGAAGLSGSLVGDDHCATTTAAHSAPDGTSWSPGIRLWPPGATCVYEIPSVAPAASGGTVDSRRFTHSEGSAGGFLATLAVGALIAGLVARAWPVVPRPVRLAAATALTFAAVGAGAIVAGVGLGVMAGLLLGVPLAFVADRKLRVARALDGPVPAGIGGAVAALCGLVLAVFLWLSGLNLEAFGLALLAVAFFGALPWPRRPSLGLLPRV